MGWFKDVYSKIGMGECQEMLLLLLLLLPLLQKKQSSMPPRLTAMFVFCLADQTTMWMRA